MYDLVKMKATTPQRIRVGGEKKNVKKWDIVEVRKSEVVFFVWYWFIEVKMEDKKPTLTTIVEKVLPKKNKKKK